MTAWAAPRQAEQASRGEVLLSIFMEFWLTDGDCPLPGAGGSSGHNTPRARTRDGWNDFNDSWGRLLSMPSSSLRHALSPDAGKDGQMPIIHFISNAIPHILVRCVGVPCQMPYQCITY
jgi:hypothetical protein